MAETKEFNSYEMSNNGIEKRAEQTTYETPEGGNGMSNTEWADLPDVAKIGFTQNDQRDMQRMGKKQEFRVRAYRVSISSSD
jgi:hypothetical protein